MKPKVAILCAAHCSPKILKTTLGTWLETYDGSYDVDVYIGLHRNYHHYHPGMDEILKLEPFVKIVLVDEIDWYKTGDTNPISHMFRYSEMHSKSLWEMMQRARQDGRDFTHVAFIDHDLFFVKDFIGKAIQEQCDGFGSLLDDNWNDREVNTTMPGVGVRVFAPKPSIWHWVISRLAFDMILEDRNMLQPGEHDGRLFDTMACGYERMKQLRMKINILKESEIREQVVHLGSMSFNFGPYQSGNLAYNKKVLEYEQEYDKRFPQGIDGLLGKLVRLG